MFILSKRSQDRLTGVKVPLVLLVGRAITITEIDFTVGEGVRSIERQRRMVDIGASRTMDSRHLTGDAVDLIALPDGRVSWEPEFYVPIGHAMKQAAQEFNIPITWGAVEQYGGDWNTFNDMPHFELPR